MVVLVPIRLPRSLRDGRHRGGTNRFSNQLRGKRWTSLAPSRSDPDSELSRDSASPRACMDPPYGSSEAYHCMPSPGGKGRERKDDSAMSLFSRLLQTVQTWRRGKRAKVTQRATVRLEQLDHRRLLSVNFTGNVPADFPVTQSPGVVVVPNTGTPPVIAPVLQPLVFNSGFGIQDIAVTYIPPSDDTLSIGLNGPPAAPSSSQSVIAGDADDNGNSGTVNPNVPDRRTQFSGFS